MPKTRNREAFTRLLLDAFTAHSEPILEQHRAELGAAIHNDLFDVDGPREVQREHSPLDHYMAHLFRGFIEIDESARTLEDIAFYIRRFPFPGTRISKERYLQFHVECYYSELYLLRERLKTYVKFIQRRFKRDVGLPALKGTCEKLEKICTDSLEAVVDVRRRHVHEHRLSDKTIDRMKMVSLLMQSPDQRMRDVMEPFHRELHQDAKRKWSKMMKESNDSIGKLLDLFFGSLQPILFDESTSKLRVPKVAAA